MAVIARRGGEQPPRAYPATVTGSRRRRDGSVTYVVEFSRGDEEADVPAKHLRVIFALEPKAKAVAAASKRDDADAVSESKTTWGGPAESGDADAVARDEKERRRDSAAESLAPTEAPRPSGFAASAVAAAGAVSLQRFYAGDAVEARFQGTRSFKRARVTDVWRERSAWLYEVRYDGPGSIRESGLREYDLRHEGEEAAAQTPSARQRSRDEAIAREAETTRRGASANQQARAPPPTGGKTDEDRAQETKADARAAEPSLGPRGRDADGRVLVAGDRVEAKYKGRGTKYFPGKVSLVRVVEGAVLLNLLYDDGDKEEGAVAANVRRLGGSKADSLSQPCAFEPFVNVDADVARKAEDGAASSRPASLNFSRLSVSFADESQERKVSSNDAGVGVGGGGGSGSGGNGAVGGAGGSPRAPGASPARSSMVGSRLTFSAPVFEMGEDFEEELAIDESDIISGGGGKTAEERERPAGPIPR